MKRNIWSVGAGRPEEMIGVGVWEEIFRIPGPDCGTLRNVFVLITEQTLAI